MLTLYSSQAGVLFYCNLKKYLTKLWFSLLRVLYNSKQSTLHLLIFMEEEHTLIPCTKFRGYYIKSLLLLRVNFHLKVSKQCWENLR